MSLQNSLKTAIQKYADDYSLQSLTLTPSSSYSICKSMLKKSGYNLSIEDTMFLQKESFQYLQDYLNPPKQQEQPPTPTSPQPKVQKLEDTDTYLFLGPKGVEKTLFDWLTLLGMSPNTEDEDELRWNYIPRLEEEFGILTIAKDYSEDSYVIGFTLTSIHTDTTNYFSFWKSLGYFQK